MHVKKWDRKQPKEETKRQGCANCASWGCFVHCASCTSIEKCILAGELWCTAKGWCPSNTSHFPPRTSYHTHSQSHTLKDYSGGANIFWCGQYLCHKRWNIGRILSQFLLGRHYLEQFKMQQWMKCNLFLFIAFPGDFLTVGWNAPPESGSKGSFELEVCEADGRGEGTCAMFVYTCLLSPSGWVFRCRTFWRPQTLYSLLSLCFKRWMQKTSCKKIWTRYFDFYLFQFGKDKV